ncbi:unnamed protein product [Laminaria digitata]
MVNVVKRRCAHDSCTKQPTFGLEGSRTATYCRQHAEEGMVPVFYKRCSHDSCIKRPTYNVQGSQTAAYCRQHADDGMVNVTHKSCAHEPCRKWPISGMLTDGAPPLCTRHTSDFLSSSVFNFRARCAVAGCRKLSRWGLDGKKPTHCITHGPLENGLVCILETGRTLKPDPSPLYRAVRGSSFHVKTEVIFGSF